MESAYTGPQVVGLLAGVLSSGKHGYEVLTEARLGPDGRLQPDIVVRAGGQQLILEVKRTHPSKAAIEGAMQQLETYLVTAELKDGLVFFWSSDARAYDLYVHQRAGQQGMIIAVHPRGDTYITLN